jgi:endo-alpha-1,4-polygalactosaminidase (GH114 family)
MINEMRNIMVPWQPWKHQTHQAHGSNTWAMDEFDVLMVDMSKHNHNKQGEDQSIHENHEKNKGSHLMLLYAS